MTFARSLLVSVAALLTQGAALAAYPSIASAPLAQEVKRLPDAVEKATTTRPGVKYDVASVGSACVLPTGGGSSSGGAPGWGGTTTAHIPGPGPSGTGRGLGGGGAAGGGGSTGLMSGCCDTGASERFASGPPDAGGGCGMGPMSAETGGRSSAVPGLLAGPGATIPDGAHTHTVLLHSGQEVWTELDLALAGVDHGVEFKLMRRHVSTFGSRDQVGLHDGQDLYFPMFGPAWSCNYQRSLWRLTDAKPSLDDSIFEEAFDQVNEFVQVAGTKVWDGVEDNFDKVIWSDAEGAPAPRIWRTGGLELVFSPFASAGPGREVARLELIRSPNGNVIKLHYANSSDPTIAEWHQVASMETSFGSRLNAGGRQVTFGYTTYSGHRVVTSVTDVVDGRTINYAYVDAAGATGGEFLDAVLRPPSADFPAGSRPKTSYTYGYSDIDLVTSPPLASVFVSPLKYNLTAVIAPNQNATASGHTRVAWTYRDAVTTPLDPFYGSVSTHTTGDPNAGPGLAAGGVTTLEYEEGPDATSSPDTNDRVVRTTITTPRGLRVEYDVSYLGQVLRETILGTAQGSTLTVRGPVGVARTSELNDGGNLTTAVGLMGDRVDVRYANSPADPTGPGAYQPVYVNPQRSAAGLQTWVKRTPDSRTTDQPYIIHEVVYEPVFNRPFQIRDPRGNVTTFIYDYMEDLDTSIPILEECLGFDEPYWQGQLRTLVDNMILGAWVDVSAQVDNETDINGDGVGGAGQPQVATCGLPIKIIHPEVALPAQAASYALMSGQGTGPSTTQVADEILRYNGFGQVVYQRDAEGNVHEFTYYPDENYAGDVIGAAGVGSVGDGMGGGYLRSFTADTVAGADRNSGAGGVPVAIHTGLAYRVTAGPTIGVSVGQTQYSRSMPTSIVDAREVRSDVQVNSLDRVVRTERAIAKVTGSSASITGLGYWTEHHYDANGNTISVRVQDENGPGGSTLYTAEYDVLNLLRRTTADAEGLALATTYAYDASLNLVAMREIDPTAPTDANKSPVTRWIYDERNILVSETRGVASTDINSVSTESTTYNQVDANGNVVKWFDATGDVVELVRDGFDRVKKVIARDGTATTVIYDAASNVTQTTAIGDIKGLTAAGVEQTVATGAVLAKTRAFYDAKNRPFLTLAETAHLGGVGPVAPSTPGALLGQLPFGISGSGTEIAHLTVFDRLDRPILEVDTEGDVSQVAYDGAGRSVRIVDPLGNESTFGYDSASNVESVTSIERPTLAGATWSDTFVATGTYDGLNRLLTWTAPNGETTTLVYDQRDNVKKSIDALGRIVDFNYDALTRPLQSIQFLELSTEGGDPSLAGVGTPDGKITIAQSWDAHSRLRTRTDDRGNVTTYSYDALHRPARTLYEDDTLETFFYNGDDELTARIGQAGDLHRYTRDPEGRLRIAQHFAPTATTQDVELPGSTLQTWAWDGLGRNWAHFDNNGLGSYNDVLVEFGFDMLGRVTGEQQSLGGVMVNPTRLAYEGAGRIVSEQYPSGRLISRSYDALDRLAAVSEVLGNTSTSIATRDYVGQGRLLRQVYGNGAVLDKSGPGTGSIPTPGGSTTGFAFDTNGRTLRHEWFAPSSMGGALITGYVSEFNGTGGVGTGRRVSEERVHLGGRKDTYMHDWAYRMTAFDRETHNGTGVVSYSSTRELDGVDKMHEFLDGDSLVTSSPGQLDREPKIDQHPVPAENGLNQYSEIDGAARDYDRLGSLQATFNGKELRFDTLKRLSRLLENGATCMEYAYDASGRRIAKIDTTGPSPLVAERYFYDCGWRVLEEQGAGGAWTKQYVDGSGIDEHLQYRLAVGGAWSTFYYHCNAQGFVGGLSNELANPVEYVEYSWLGEAAFLDVAGALVDGDTVTPGVQPLTESSTGNPYLFQGRRLDPETGLYHFRHRQYDTTTGSFISIDPSGMWRHGQGNGYSSFGADMWGVIDPFGLAPQPNQQTFIDVGQGGTLVPASPSEALARSLAANRYIAQREAQLEEERMRERREFDEHWARVRGFYGVGCEYIRGFQRRKSFYSVYIAAATAEVSLGVAAVSMSTTSALAASGGLGGAEAAVADELLIGTRAITQGGPYNDGMWAAIIFDGKVYAAQMHFGAMELAGCVGTQVVRDGIVILRNGIVVGWL